jgi:hypothetical protein
MRSDGAGAAAGPAGVAWLGLAHTVDAEGLLLHLQQRLRPMVAQLDMHPIPTLNVLGRPTLQPSSVALPLGSLLAVRVVRRKAVHLQVHFGSH